MTDKTIKLAGLIAGIIVIMGIVIIGTQYLSQIGDGASALVAMPTEIPAVVSVPKEDFITIQSLLDRYDAVSDLATKNQIIHQLKLVVGGLVK